ncbi:DUF2501 domain-containing protein [Variovorax guangxiensis]|uniref:DUF2501 domain-containing protein n=1 Tax=Variovorax guangxiensis TaxID=1775474 RepID=UPI0028593786|nr:DUF2501 domain-containing protein [Variovorax guangxiensis]MDR6858106.1 hypothetical protein [Variovorax guangxiensis]
MKARAPLVAFALLVIAMSTLAQNQTLNMFKDKLNKSNATSGTGSGAAEGAGGAAGTGAALASGLGLSMPKIGSSTMGNAAGVLQYCIKNNYLSADAANSVKDKLLSTVTGQKPQQTGYANGAKGLLQGSDGKSLNLKNISGQLKTKACDYVLANAKSLV